MPSNIGYMVCLQGRIYVLIHGKINVEICKQYTTVV